MKTIAAGTFALLSVLGVYESIVVPSLDAVSSALTIPVGHD